MEPRHLGDGAYVSEGAYKNSIAITANHHDPDRATDTVFLDPEAIKSLLRWLEQRDERNS